MVDFQSEQFEHIYVDVYVSSKKCYINVLYQPPNETVKDQNLFLQVSNSLLEKLDNYNAYTSILSGDLNFGNIYSEKFALEHKPLDHDASDLYATYGFSQIIDIPTRFSKNCTSPYVFSKNFERRLYSKQL